MEYRIKQGDDLICSYTGKPSKVLIQLIDKDNNATSYLSREALLNADKLLKALEGVQEIQIPSGYGVPYFQPNMIPDVTCDRINSGSQPLGSNQIIVTNSTELEKKTDVHAAKAFEQACLKLIEDPPPDKNGNQTGVPGFAIRDLVKKWKPNFQSPQSMYPIIQKHFNSPKEVVDFWLGME